MAIFLFIALPLFFLIIEFVNRKILKNNDSIIDNFVNNPKRLSLKQKRLEFKKARIEAKQKRLAEKIKNIDE